MELTFSNSKTKDKEIKRQAHTETHGHVRWHLTINGTSYTIVQEMITKYEAEEGKER